MATIPTNQILSKSTIKLTRYAEICSTIALFIAIAALGYSLYQVVFRPDESSTIFKEAFLKPSSNFKFSGLELALAQFLWMLDALVGIAAICFTRELFIGYQKGEVFTMEAAKIIKIIGWLLVSLVIVSQITHFIGIATFRLLDEPRSLSLILSLEESDVYGVIFGLLIVIIGHVMYEAVRLSEENKAII